HQIKQKAILTDGLFALVRNKCRMRRWRVLPDLRRVAASVDIRIIPPHTPDSATDTVSPNCPLPYILLTRNLSLSSSITIFLLTKFMVKVA
ncbi:TPA: hypothetical protein ACYRQ7_001028, partial [Escherichia coli]|nr:hypothetical protein [Escherichia coli]MCN2442505.1 hypothetical protein [Escherichia coli]MCN4958756.1 hypothetical protein [Escherichia coli]